MGDSDFRATGDELVQLFVTLAGLQPHERVLDVGCGIGRVARPLAHYIRPPGAYEGFDVVEEGVAWCARRYARDHPHFRFRLAEVANGMYRPGAAVSASEYTFPYADESFDFAFATSLFTHLLPADADRYLSEMARVTRPAGRILATFFLLTPDTSGERADGGLVSFPQRHDHYATSSADTPEAAVAYEETWVRERFAAHGLEPIEPVRYGTWSGGPGGVSMQDIVIARRRADVGAGAS